MIIKKKVSFLEKRSFKILILSFLIFFSISIGVFLSDEIKDSFNNLAGYVTFFSKEITDDLIIYYDFNEKNGSIIYDKSPFINNGEIVNTERVPGIKGNALSFNGVDSYIISNKQTGISKWDRTICLWAKSNKLGQNGCLINFGQTESNGLFGLLESQNELIVNVWSNDWPSKINITNSEWNHYCITYNHNSDIKSYKNGNLIANSFIVPLKTIDTELIIGKRNNQGGDFYYNGLIDEIMVFSRELNKNEINSIYDYGLNINNQIKKEDLNTLKLITSEEEFQKISTKRDEYLRDGMHFSEEDFIPANISYKGEIIKGEIRFKGDCSDHLEEGRWSFRVKIKDDDKTLFGMKKFSLQAPERRGGFYEWLYYKALKEENLISLRYKFINLTLNNKSLGIYTIEEHFDKELIENNKRRDGPIIKFNEDILGTIVNEGLTYTSPYLYTNIDTFKIESLLEDPEKYDSFIIGRNLIELLRQRRLKTSDVFDISQLAKFIALTNLFGSASAHPTLLHNQRFYYNPITSLLEPVGFDIMAGQKITSLIYTDESTLSQFSNIFFEDTEFIKKYIKELERISKKEYLDQFFNKLPEDYVHEFSKTIPGPPFSKEVLYINQEMIKKIINPPYEPIIANFEEFNQTESMLTLKVGNIHQLPIEILSIKYKGIEISNTLFENNIINIYEPYHPIKFQEFKFKMRNDFKIDDLKNLLDLTINYRVIGASLIKNVAINPWPQLAEDFLETDLIRQESNINKFEFLIIDDLNKQIIIKKGNWVLENNLIIPKNYTVICGNGTTINLINNSKIISYSNLQFLGNNDKKIVITSTDGTGQGLVVLQESKTSNLRYVTFSNLSEPKQNGWQLTGAVTFYESPVNIENCGFINSNSEDGLNIIRTVFNITNSTFENSFSDCFDGDFVEGKIENTIFEKCGNDGVDISGSSIVINKLSLNNINDKGISSGEKSYVFIKNSNITNCFIGVASKDSSEVKIDLLNIQNSNYGLSAYQKKPEFGPSTINVTEITFFNNENDYLIEMGSNLIINDNNMINKELTVYEQLYGVD